MEKTVKKVYPKSKAEIQYALIGTYLDKKLADNSVSKKDMYFILLKFANRHKDESAYLKIIADTRP